ncbi:hypothetical protein [Empedobacter tilapiae]|uniref:hypothetical protein n=1 Tax=Empedobacter tilapiae TaxID=2491114 RepID=UPI0028CFFF84|nr:hypothetical protein [Empedobacter tilapiae]
MKKFTYFLMVTLVTLFTFSCSNDDDSGNGDVNNPKNSYLKVIIDGKEKTFNTIIVNKTIDEYEINVLQVTASINNESSEKINFTLKDGQIGSDATSKYGWFTYTINNKTYQESGFSHIISKNSNNKIEGTFSGKMNAYNNDAQQYEYKEFTKGEFKIQY